MLRAPAILCLALAVSAAPLGCGTGASDQLAAARAFQEDGQFQESIEPLRRVLAETPDDPEANYLLGLALLRTGRVAPAVWPLRKASEHPEYADLAGQLLVVALINSANLEEAVASVDRLLERKPGDPALLRLRAQANLLARRNDQAYEDARRILEVEPGDLNTAMTAATALYELERWDEARAAFEQLREDATKAGDLGMAGRACVSRAAVEEKLEAFDEATRLVEICLADHPTDPVVLQLASEYFMRLQRPDRSEALWRAAIERAPESLPFRLGLGNTLLAMGRAEESIQVLTEAAEEFASPQAWEALSEVYRRTGDYAKSQQVLEQAIQSGADTERLRFKRADILIDAGDLEAAEAIAAELEESSFRDFIRGRAMLLRGDARGALEALEAGLARWPDNAFARAAAGRAAQEVGDYDRAFEHYRQAMRADVQATDAALAGAHLARSLGRANDAVEFIRYHVATRIDPQPELIEFAIDTAREAGNARIEQELLALVGVRVQEKRPGFVALQARLDAAREGPAAGLKRIDESGLDLTQPSNEPALRARVDLLIREGRTDAAVAAVERAVAAHPDVAILHDLRARALAAAGRNEEARAAVDEALALDPDFAPALAAKGALAVAANDLPAALAAFDQAVAANPSDVESAHRAAQVALGTGDRAGAEKRLRALLVQAPAHVGANNDLAWLLAEDGRDLEFAQGLAERAVRLSGDASPDVVDTLAFVQLARGDAQGAVATLEGGLEKHPDSGLLRYRLGAAREKLGDAEAALAAYREALEDESFAQAEAARAQIARLEAAGATR